MDLSDLRQRLSDVYGNALASNNDFYDRIINDAYQKLCSLADWWWLETYDVLRFNAPVVTDRDFDCTLGASAITASAASDTVGTAYKYGWCYTGEHTYRILDVSASSPEVITLDANFIEASTVYGITFWNDTLTLATAFDHAVSLAPRKDPNHKPLAHITLEHIEQYGPDLSTYETEVGKAYAIYRETTIDPDQFRLRLFPPPDETAEYILRYIQTPSALSASSDVPLLPTKHHQVLADMARLELVKVTGADNPEVGLWMDSVRNGVQRMLSDQTKRGGVERRFGRRGTRQTMTLPYKLTNYTVGDPI